MSRNKKPHDAECARKVRVDQLATRLLLETDLPDATFDGTAALELLASDAKSSSRQDLAAVAGEIAIQLEKNAGKASASLLEAGIAKLQEALERPADGEPSAPAAPPPHNATASGPALLAAL